MPFEKGKSGNPTGRPPGAGDEKNRQVRELISAMIEKYFKLENIEKDLQQLKPKDRLAFLSRLLDFVLPKMRATEMKVNYENLSDEQLDHVIDKILNI